VHLACICAGWGAHRDAIAQAAIAGGVGDRVALPGRLHQDLVAAFLAQADLVAVPSRAESFGWVMVEPMILGLPLVATRVGIAHELEGEGAAEIVAPGDAPAFAAALERVLRDPTAARARAERGRAYVERACDLPRVVDALVSVYESVLRPKATRPASAVPLPAA
jgi:glycosyltransferase involved in cell wall biosynthesis